MVDTVAHGVTDVMKGSLVREGRCEGAVEGWL